MPDQLATQMDWREQIGTDLATVTHYAVEHPFGTLVLLLVIIAACRGTLWL